MERDALNFYEPFERLAPNHENQLTRALLLVLRLSPVVHQAWLSRVAPGMRLHELPPAAFDTQRRAVRAARSVDEQVPLVSVFLAPSEPLSDDTIVRESERLQVLDAVIEYGEDLVVVIENKVAEASDAQARELNVDGAGVQITAGQERQVVTWPQIIGDITVVLERNLVGGTERLILEDFLAYVEDHFGGLGPYRTLGLCADNEFRVARRLRALLVEAAGQEARIDKWGPTVALPALLGTAARAYLFATPNVELSLYPADTLSQARAFYTRTAAVDAIKALAQRPGWDLKPNFHFGHMEGGYTWTTTSINAASYIALWQQKIAETVAVKRADWDAYWSWLIEQRIATQQDRPDFDRHFTATAANRQRHDPGSCSSGAGSARKRRSSMGRTRCRARSRPRWTRRLPCCRETRRRRLPRSPADCLRSVEVVVADDAALQRDLRKPRVCGFWPNQLERERSRPRLATPRSGWTAQLPVAGLCKDSSALLRCSSVSTARSTQNHRS